MANKLNLSREDFFKILEKLRHFYPSTFSEEEIKPLKIGIDKDIIEDKQINITRTKIRKFLYGYCISKAYIKAHQISLKRYDLQGKEVEEITKSQYDFYQKILRKKALKQKMKEKLNKNNQEKSSNARSNKPRN